MQFDPGVLAVDADSIICDIENALRRDVLSTLKRKGIVVGLSGGIDSSVVAALAVRALGPERVLAVLMPERDSSPASLELGKMLSDHLGVASVVENIAPALEAIGCYRRQEEAIRRVFPEYDAEEGWRCKLTLPSIAEGDPLDVFTLTVRSPDGTEQSSRMPPEAYRQLVAATNYKQRLRKTMEYYHADRLDYVAAGLKPIAHLDKTQVYALAERLGVPEIIRSRPPTTQTFSMEQTEEEFYESATRERDRVRVGALRAADTALDSHVTAVTDHRELFRSQRDAVRVPLTERAAAERQLVVVQATGR